MGCHSLLQWELPQPRTEPQSPALPANYLPSEPPGKPNRNKGHLKCNGLETFPPSTSPTLVHRKLSSMKPVPGAQKVGDPCTKVCPRSPFLSWACSLHFQVLFDNVFFIANEKSAPNHALFHGRIDNRKRKALGYGVSPASR